MFLELTLITACFDFSLTAMKRGEDIRIRKDTTDRRLELGSKEICVRLDVAVETPLLYIERIGQVRSDQVSYPTFIEYSWWIAELVPGLEKPDTHIPDLFYALIVDKYDIPIVRAEETLTASACDEITADKLGIPIDSPVVVLNRATYTVNDKIVEVRTTKGRADQFSYKREIR